MLLRYYNQFDGQSRIATVRGDRFSIGKGHQNDIVLDSYIVDDTSLVLTRDVEQDREHWRVEVCGLSGCKIGEEELRTSSMTRWDGRLRLTVFPYCFEIVSQTSKSNVERRMTQQIHELIRRIHIDVLQHLHLNDVADAIPKETKDVLNIERVILGSAHQLGVGRNKDLPLTLELAGCCLRDELLDRLLGQRAALAESRKDDQHWTEFVSAKSDREEQVEQWVATCLTELGLEQATDDLATQIRCLEEMYWPLWERVASKLPSSLADYLAFRYLIKQLKDTLYGFGPLEDLLRIPTITEIMVNARDEIFIERDGKIQNSGRQFVSDAVTTSVIERIVQPVGRRIDTAQPMVDARLPDGSRVNAVIPPLAVKGPCLTIRKFSEFRFDLEELVDLGSLSTQVAAFLTACVRSKRSVLVSGGTGTGKTTLLNCLSLEIPVQERIICIEDTHELQLNHPHVVFVECRDANTENVGSVSIRDLLKNALRQRPDRIVVGECRGAEALDMLQAMNTGHDGSMTTIHANSPSDALRRLEVLVRESGLPADAIRHQIVSAIDVIVQIRRIPKGHPRSGARYVAEVAEVIGVDPRNGQIEVRPLFISQEVDMKAIPVARSKGYLPTFIQSLLEQDLLQLSTFFGAEAHPSLAEGTSEHLGETNHA